MTSPWLDREQAAEYCGGCSLRFFDKHIRKNVPSANIGRKPLWETADLDKYIRSKKSEDAGEFLA